MSSQNPGPYEGIIKSISSQDPGPYEGIIKSYNGQNGYGFLDCAELHAQYGRDVFLHKNEFLSSGCEVGAAVVFGIELDPKVGGAAVVFGIELDPKVLG